MLNLFEMRFFVKSNFVETLLKALTITVSFFSLLKTCISEVSKIGEKIAQLWGYPENIGYLYGALGGLLILIVVFCNNCVCIINKTTRKQ